MQLEFSFRGMVITVVEPLARHDVQKQRLHILLASEWSVRNGDKPTVTMDDMAWFEIMEFAKLFIGVAHVENPAGYMPPTPLSFNDAPACYDAMLAFWDDAPLAFADALREARDDLESLPDPND